METFSNFFKKSVSGYFESLPLPSSFGGIVKLSAKEWLQLVPFFTSMGLVGYVTYKEVNDFMNRKQIAWINKDYCKEKNKIADIITSAEITDILSKSDKVAYCRCWKSAKFPFCDGAHGAHNTATGDNVGPLVIKK